MNHYDSSRQIEEWILALIGLMVFLEWVDVWVRFLENARAEVKLQTEEKWRAIMVKVVLWFRERNNYNNTN